MNVESEVASDLKDVDMVDASNAAASAPTQSLPSNRFDLEVCTRFVLFFEEI